MAADIERKTHIILFENPIWKGLIALSIPVFFVNILRTLHDVVDGIFLGRVPDIDGFSVSTSMQSAIALTWPVYFIFISFGMGLSVAGSALIGQYLGRGDLDNAKKYAFNTVVISLALGALFNLIVYLGAPVILRWMGATDPDYSYAVTYLRIRSFELPILFLSFGFQAIRQASGDTLTPVLINAFAIIVNIILTPILILGYNLGIVGAAVSTLVAHWLMLPFVMMMLIKAKTGVRIRFRTKYIQPVVIRDIFRIAIPASSGQAIQALGFVILNALIYSFGSATSAAFYIGNRINSLIMFPVLSISAIVSIYVAQNIGAGNIPRAKQAFKTGMFLGVLFMTIGALLIIPFRFFLVGLFNSDPTTMALASEYTFYLHIGLPLMAVFQTYLSTFQGSGETKYGFAMAVIRLWIIRVPLVLLSMKFTDLGPAGVWYAILISNVLIIFVGMYLYARMKFLPKIRTAVKEEVLA
mgnify:CR=1 FL=1